MTERFVPGLLKGMATTARQLASPTHTHEYPDVAPDLPARSRGVIALVEQNCTSCMLCARECPDWCIYIEGHKEKAPPRRPGGMGGALLDPLHPSPGVPLSLAHDAYRRKAHHRHRALAQRDRSDPFGSHC